MPTLSRVILYALIAGVCFYGIMAYVVRRRKNPSTRSAPQRPIRPAHKLRAELISACFNDRGAADRLIAHECKLFPGISTQVAITRALDRLCRDRGRNSRAEQAVYNPKEFRGSKGSPPKQTEFDALVRACRGDQKTAKGLIELELKKKPGITRDDAVARAIDRLTYDRGR